MRGDKTRPEGRDVAGVVPVLMPDAVIGADKAPSTVLYPHLSRGYSRGYARPSGPTPPQPETLLGGHLCGVIPAQLPTE